MKIKFFDTAKRLSKKSEHHKHHIGCVIVNKNTLVGFGFNKLKTHPKSNHKYKSTHAELHAILGVPRDELRGSDMYLYRQHRDGQLATAKPCKYCEKLIKQSGIKRVFHTVEGGYDYYKVE